MWALEQGICKQAEGQIQPGGCSYRVLLDSICLHMVYSCCSAITMELNCCSKIQKEMPVWEDPLEEEMATHSSSLAWKTPWTEEPGQLQFMGLQRVRLD